MNMKKIVMVVTVLMIGLIWTAGCKKKEQTPKLPAVEDVNKQTAAGEQTICPVMEGNKIDKNVFVEYKGKKVYFCCAACKGEFEKEPEKYIAKLPQFAK
jgi:YHS domain-containing protein